MKISVVVVVVVLLGVGIIELFRDPCDEGFLSLFATSPPTIYGGFSDDGSDDLPDNAIFDDNSSLLVFKQYGGGPMEWGKNWFVFVDDSNGIRHELKPVEYRPGAGITTDAIDNQYVKITDATGDCSWAHDKEELEIHVFDLVDPKCEKARMVEDSVLGGHETVILD